MPPSDPPPKLPSFTPCFDRVVARYGVVAALVYGAMWRYSQMSVGLCTASLAAIARRAGVSRRTAILYIQRLEAHGLVHDLTPRRRNIPHAYRVAQPWTLPVPEADENEVWIGYHSPDA